MADWTVRFARARRGSSGSSRIAVAAAAVVDSWGPMLG